MTSLILIFYKLNIAYGYSKSLHPDHPNLSNPIGQLEIFRYYNPHLNDPVLLYPRQKDLLKYIFTQTQQHKRC